MPDQKTIDAAEVKRIFGLQEGHFIDVKAVEIGPAKLSESISAFGNAAGGELFVGIGEDRGTKTRYWNGFPDMEAANGLFQVLDRMTPFGGIYSATFLNNAELPGQVLHLVISKTRAILRSTDGTVFKRYNAQNLRVFGDDAMRRLELDKGIVTFEDDTVNIPADAITNSLTTLNFITEVVPSQEPEEWMRKQNLLNDGRPIVAGVLLFADEPQAAIPKRSAIKIYRYGTKDDDGRRDQLMFGPITIEGCLYQQIYTAVARTKQEVEGIKILTRNGLELVSYPHDTLHEIITNAVLHRDYSIPADIQVRIFDNRIEVESPGRLPGHVTTDNILQEQSARNPRLIRLIHKFPNPPNMDIGEGLNTAFEAMRKLRLREPEVIENELSVTVHIRHTDLATPHDTVMHYLSDHDEIQNKVARDLTGIHSENVMKDVFLSLKKAKLIERVPDKRGNASAWRKYTGYYDPKPDDDVPKGTQLHFLEKFPPVEPLNPPVKKKP